ncbi:winged helix-turn-helix domain-containing protein [Pedobacter sp. PWIIR3]
MNITVLKVIAPMAFCVLITMLGGMLASNASLDDQSDATMEMIVMREVGHKLLLQSGDSTSRVLPVKLLANNQYQITFEKKLGFLPDSLMKIVKESLATAGLSKDYIVNVQRYGSSQMVYGYAVLAQEQKSILACRGRMQPKDFYSINIQFKDNAIISSRQQRTIYMGMPILAVLGYGLYTFNMMRRKKRILSAGEILLGNSLFNVADQYLVVNQEKKDLTEKETRLLEIFFQSPNQVIDRSRLQKEIWEDEGVIVGRSLDVFISKLRKKLEADTGLQLVNIHGKGYRLEVRDSA